MTDNNPSYELDRSARFRMVGGEGVVILQKLGEVAVLNDAGSVIADCLRQGKSIDETVSRLVTEFEVEEQQALSDTRSFATELVSLGALKEVTP